jgi:long-subunit fatty acid transport protein
MQALPSLRLARRESGRLFGLVALASLGAAPAMAQEGQDEIDLQGRTSVILGSGARALGMGGAFLARADDATAASWNPAGLSYLRRPELSLVGAQITFKANQGDDRNRFKGTSPDFAAFTFPLSIKSAGGAAQISFQRVVPFDGSRVIDRLSGPSVSLESSGGFDVIALGTGWKLTPKLRLGVTLNRWVRGFDQDQTRTRPVEGGRPFEIVTEWEMRGWNSNVGLIFSPNEALNLAVVGKTPFTAKVNLKKSRTDFVTSSDGSLDVFSSSAYESDDVTLDFPGAFGAGVSWRPESRLTLSADYTRTFWSKSHVYNFFVIRVAESSEGPAVRQPPAAQDILPKRPFPYVREWSEEGKSNQEDSEQIRVGVEYVFIGRKVKVPLRVGYFNDRQIRRDLDGHVPRFNGFTAGTGLIVGPVLFDVAYLYEHGSFVDAVDFNPITQRTHLVLASVIYRFGSRP